MKCKAVRRLANPFRGPKPTTRSSARECSVETACQGSGHDCGKANANGFDSFFKVSNTRLLSI